MLRVLRPAVRVVCLDQRQRLLLLRWRDPADGSYVWEPPGGGVEPGEQPIDAARRELQEETGLPGAA
jgi:8-oxo-dGTP pyrophosphatase MutT (NUDIX family)